MALIRRSFFKQFLLGVDQWSLSIIVVVITNECAGKRTRAVANLYLMQSILMLRLYSQSYSTKAILGKVLACVHYVFFEVICKNPNFRTENLVQSGWDISLIFDNKILRRNIPQRHCESINIMRDNHFNLQLCAVDFFIDMLRIYPECLGMIAQKLLKKHGSGECRGNSVT